MISHYSFIPQLRRHVQSRIAAFWLLIALLPKLLLPVGFMPGDAATGNWVVICSAGFFKLVQVDEHGVFIKHHQPQVSYSHCPFAAAALDTGGISILPVVMIATALPVSTAFIGRYVPQHGPSRAQRSRAPPHFS